jgi:hypothetical protein
MDVNQRLKVLEDEVKVLKAELKSVLLDIREQYLNNQNPFTNSGRAPEQSGRDGNCDRADAILPTVVVRESVIERDKAPQHSERDIKEDAAESPSNGRKSTTATLSSPALTESSWPREENLCHQAGESHPVRLDMAVIAGLTEWVDKSVRRIGKQRTGAIVEGLHCIGRLPGGMKDFLVRFVQLSPDSEPERQLRARDYLTVLSQLEGLLGQSGKPELSLLTLLNSDEASEWTKQ